MVTNLRIKYSPWGEPDHVSKRYPGIFEIGTASHGGFKLSVNMNNRIPMLFRNPGGFYEEDCEWSIVAIYHPQAFTLDEIKKAIEVFKWQIDNGYLPKNLPRKN